MRVLTWTPDLAKRFWADLAGTEFLAGITFSRFAAPYLVELCHGFLTKQTVALDFGGGFNAYLTRELLKKGVSVRIYEPSLQEKQLAFDIRENPKFLGTDESITPNGYDVIFAVEVVEHLFDEDLRRVMSMIRAGLKSGGMLVITTPDKEDLRLSSRYCPTCRHLFHPWGHLRSLDENSLKELLKGSGFACDSVLNVDFSNARYPTEQLKSLKKEIAAKAEEAQQILKSFGGLGRFMLPRRVRKLIADVVGWKEAAVFGELSEGTTDRQIGSGGTLVAFGRKIQV